MAKGDKAPKAKDAKVDASAVAYASAIMEAKSEAVIGFGIMCLFPRPPPENVVHQPEMLTKQFNPRDAPIEEVVEFIKQCQTKEGRLDRANWKFALTMLVDPKDIVNLDEIKRWAPGSSDPMVNIVWTITDANGRVRTMTLGNGNHRFEAVRKLLEAEFAKVADLEMWIIDYKTKIPASVLDTANYVKARRDLRAVWEIIEKESTFAVELYDIREHFIQTLCFDSRVR